MWNGGQLPWGAPYLQDIKQTMLQKDSGYQEARTWWQQNQQQAAADRSRVADLERELQRANEEYSNLSMRYGSALDHINRAERLRRVPRGETAAKPEAGPSAPAAELPQRASEPGPIPDARGPADDVDGPERPPEPADAGLGEGADPVDEARGGGAELGGQ